MSPNIPGYAYPPPSKGDFLNSLLRVLGPDEGRRAWDHACHVASVSPDGADPAVAELTAVARVLIQMQGLRAVVGNSMVVRLITHETLARRAMEAEQGRSA